LFSHATKDRDSIDNLAVENCVKNINSYYKNKLKNKKKYHTEQFENLIEKSLKKMLLNSKTY